MDEFKKISDAIHFSSDKMKKNGLFETDRIFCDLYCLEPGQSQAVHTHEGSDKVYYVLQGKGVFQIGDQEKEVAAEEIVLASSGQKHGVKNAGTDRLTLLVFMAPKPTH